MEQKTALYDLHVQSGGKMVPFAGFSLPMQYELGIVGEHQAVRSAAGLFDVSHMGEVLVRGGEALRYLQQLLTNDFSNMKNGQARYSPMCDHSGGVLDDLLVYRLAADEYLLVINAANRAKDVAWMKKQAIDGMSLEDVSDSYAQLALQGPKAEAILRKITSPDEIPQKYYSFCAQAKVAGINCLLSRTGYTGEDGFELYLDPKDASALAQAILEAGAEFSIALCGLGARDTLRLEAAMPLYGQELTEEITPIEAGLNFAVKMAKEAFNGKQAMELKGTPLMKRVGLKLLDRGIAREGAPVLLGDQQVGLVSSGTQGPTLGYPIAMARVDAAVAEVGTELLLEVRGRKLRAEVVPMPFYKRA